MTLRLKLTLILGTLISVMLLLMPVLFPLNGNQGPDLIAAFGRFHILALHFPIALLLLVPIFETLGLFQSLRYLKEASYILLILAILSASKACVLGYMLASAEGNFGSQIVSHMWAGIITTILMVIALLLKQALLKTSNKLLLRGYYSTLAVSIISLTIGSHDGASLVHGDDYLYAKFPAPIRELFTDRKETTVTLDSPIYDALIQPIFEKKCYLCHHNKRQKGNFRVDDYELLLYGGESGIAGIEPGHLEGSEVYYRITLDPSKKGFMPPEGTTSLSEQEVAVIAWWIKNGASPTASINEVTSVDYPKAVKLAVEEMDNFP